MSHEASTWVWDHAKASGNDLIVLLKIADNANADGGGAYPGIAYLARTARISKRAVYDCLRRLKASGELVEEAGGGGRGRKTTYRVVMNGATSAPIPSQGNGAARRVETVQPAARNGADPGIAYMEEPPLNLPENLPPTAVPANAGSTSAEVIPLRNDRALRAAEDTLGRLKAEVEQGRRSWSLSEAATAEWLALLDDDHGLRGAQEFVMFYLAANLDRDVRSFAPAHWSMAGLRVRRWRGLVLHGVDEAITRVDVDETDARGKIGQPFWAYVEKVCQATHARNQAGGA